MGFKKEGCCRENELGLQGLEAVGRVRGRGSRSEE